VGGGGWAVRAAVDAPARGAVLYPVFAWGPAASDWGAVREHAVEAELAELDEHQVDHDHDRERGEEAGGERDEPEHVGERGERQQHADRDADGGCECDGVLGVP
jgi:hypothetical protein